MCLRVKSSQNFTGLSTNSGQAVIEYVLILVITVSLILALVYQVFKPFQSFVQSYMGSYVECLLESSELPSFGYEEAEINAESCSAKFAGATWNKGRPPLGEGSSGSDSDNSANASSSSSSESSRSSGNGRAGSASRGGSSTFKSPSSPPRGVGDGAGDGKTTEIAIDDSGGGFFKGSTGSSYAVQSRKKSYVAITGLTEEERKKITKKPEPRGAPLIVSEGLGAAPKKTAVKPPPAREVAQEKEEGFTIGNFIRIIFIAAIIIALVLFIGGQALQMSKSFNE